MTHATSDGSEVDAGREAPMPVDDIMVVLGQLFVAILTALIIALADADVADLVDATSVLLLGDPAMMSNFTA